MAFRGSKAGLRIHTANNRAQATLLTREENSLGVSVGSFNQPTTIREVPGEKLAYKREHVGRYDSTLSFTCDSNEITAPLFDGQSGKRRFFWYAPDETPGKAEYAFAGYMQISETIQANGIIMYTVNVVGDSEVTEATL